jgi:catechol 2,3-dioxygenase-like lactoylglutathione lyase family enzyme
MLGSETVYVHMAVKSLEAGKKFYVDTLGFQVVEDNPGGSMLKSGEGMFFIYESQFAGTNQATAAGWTVANVEEAVQELKGKGVAFEHYDMPGMTMEGDIHVMGDMKAAWFKDPDGNILCVANKA